MESVIQKTISNSEIIESNITPSGNVIIAFKYLDWPEKKVRVLAPDQARSFATDLLTLANKAEYGE